MPTICRPLVEYLVFRSCSLGNDFLQGSQKVPQKSTRTTLPRIDLSETVPEPPLTGLTLKSGAGLPTRPPGSPLDEEPLPSAPALPQARSERDARTRLRRSADARWLMVGLVSRVRANAPPRTSPGLTSSS